MKIVDKIAIAYKKDKHLIHMGIMFLMCIFLAITVFFVFVKPSSEKYVYQILNVGAAELSAGQIDPSTEIRQTFTVQKMDSVSIWINPYNQSNTSLLELSLVNAESKEEVYTGIIDLSVIGLEAEYVNYRLTTPIEHAQPTEYEMIVRSADSDASKPLALMYSSDDLYNQGQLTINGVVQKGDLAFQLFMTGDNFLCVIFWIATAAFILFLFAIYFLIFIKKCRIEKIFLVSALFLGIIYMFVLTPYSSYDEPAHIDTAYRYSNDLMLKGHATENGGILKRAEDTMDGLTAHGPTLSTYHTVYNRFFSMAQDTTLVEVEGRDVAVAPYAYLPATIGITVARVLHLGQIPLLYLGRLCNLLFFVFAAYFAIKKMPFAKKVMFAVCMMPMTLHQAGSFSYDAIVNGLAFLFTAYCLYVVYTENKVKTKDILLLCIFGALLAPCKSIYVVICFLCVLIPKVRFETTKKQIRMIAIILGICIVSFCAFNLMIVKDSISTSGDIIEHWGKPGYGLSTVLQQPAQVIKMFFKTILEHGQYYLTTLVSGFYLIDMPFFISYICLGFLILSAVKPTDEKQYIKPGHKLWFLLIIAGVYVLAHLSMLLAFTPQGSEIILGVQGRYFIPILPLAVLLMRNTNIVSTKNRDRQFMFSMCVFQAVTLTFAFMSVIGYN